MLFCCALTDAQLDTKNQQIEVLISKLAKGDTAAMDRLYELIKTDVYAFALSKSMNPHDAEDITHDTFVQIYRYAKRYEALGKPLAWIFTIETSLANRNFQLSQRTTSMEEDLEEVADATQFESEIINNEFLNQLLGTLSKEEQQVIVLHIVSGLKHHEIASLLDKPLSTVLSKYNRAIKKLQNSVKEV